MKKTLTLVRTAIIFFYAVCLLLLIYVIIKNPLKNDVYAFKFHDSTVFCCPSCGLTRAVYCLFTLRIKQAFYYHAFFTLFSPVIAYIALTLTINLFASKKISVATLVAVYVATSDEAIPLMIANIKSIPTLLILITVKIVFAIALGYFIGFLHKLVFKNPYEKII